jgi:DNA-binding LytR/AlgR family response regulator
VLPVFGSLIESAPARLAPAKLGDDIISLHASDHYAELVTTKGRALLTEPFGDCLERT